MHFCLSQIVPLSVEDTCPLGPQLWSNAICAFVASVRSQGLPCLPRIQGCTRQPAPGALGGVLSANVTVAAA